MGDRVVVVTGGSKGIGYAVARALIQDGYTVTITSRHADEVTQAAAELGGQARGAACDVRDPQAVQAAVDAVTARGALVIAGAANDELVLGHGALS